MVAEETQLCRCLWGDHRARRYWADFGGGVKEGGGKLTLFLELIFHRPVLLPRAGSGGEACMCMWYQTGRHRLSLSWEWLWETLKVRGLNHQSEFEFDPFL